MLNPSRLYNIRQIDRQTITNLVYIVTFSYLILFSIFNSLYLGKVPPLELHQPHDYDLEHVAFKHISCSFPISSYYARTPRYICYLLLVLTIVSRNHKWLVAGAAASVLTYSGVAAIHLIILFATNNRLNLSKEKSHCESLPIPGASIPFVACAGVSEPDSSVGMTIVSSVMLGALPTVAWSGTFRRSTSKAILICWLLLMAVGHTFYALTSNGLRQPFQICPKDYVEPLPMASFQAPFLDRSWRDSFASLVSTGQQSSQSPINGSPACIYSCFATTGYVGRQTQDIGVWDGVRAQHPVVSSDAAHRRGSVISWWAYTLLAFLTLVTTEEKGRLPKGFHKLLFSIEYHQEPLASRWKWKTVTNIAIKWTKDSTITTDSSEATTLVHTHITVLKVVQIFTQIVSSGAFCFSIIIQETQNARWWSTLSQEPFAAVGQWSNLVVVLLVLVAAGVGRIWAGTRASSAATEDERKLKEEIEELGGDWDWRIGYAS
ncbi:hypothetical protein MMC07_007833 [Pseudocyphellaria aurata]|nr:hypothetical protein [Pseudocyphellaria aurata]